MLMPSVQPSELWQETGRWQTFGPLLLKMKDRAEREYCFGPTHEEVITDIVRNQVNSYKQLPVNFYQIQTKFRDEIRPRFGVMRAREFLMKDAYSFHLKASSLEKTYQDMHQAYCRIFDRMGLAYRPVDADSGAIGGSMSCEFQVLADSGEDLIFYSDQSDYAANLEKATYLKPEKDESEAPLPQDIVDTPGAKTINDVVEFLKLPIEKTVKTLIVEGADEDNPLVAIVLRGDHELNEVQAENHPLVKAPLSFVDEDAASKALGAPFGSLGPANLAMPILVDYSAHVLTNFCCGANEKDKHFINVNWDRDANATEVTYLRNVVEGDLSPDGQGKLKSCRGIEVGHIFQLGNKYSKDMNATVLDENGKAQLLQMGCYGLGVSRVVAASIEQNHDKYGIIWPRAIAPFRFIITPLNMHKSEKTKEKAEALYQFLLENKQEVLFDDRNERAGVMFADSELIGIPYRFVVSDKGLDAGIVEFKARDKEEKEQISLDELEAFMQERFA